MVNSDNLETGDIIMDRQTLKGLEVGAKAWSASFGSTEIGSGLPYEKVEDGSWFDMINTRFVSENELHPPVLLVAFKNRENSTMIAIRENYGVPARIGAEIRYNDDGDIYTAHIVGSTENQIHVKFAYGSPMLNDLIHLHPTNHIIYK